MQKKSNNDERRAQLPSEAEKPQDPFVLRKALVLGAALPAVALGFFLENVWSGLSSYFVLVTLADLISHYGLNLRPSHGVGPEQLMLFQHVTPEQFDAYFDTRRWIRCGSMILALAAGGLALAFFPAVGWKVFCAMYVLSTLVGILYVRFLGIPRPKLFRRDDRYYVSNSRPRPGHLDPGQLPLAFEDKHPYGPIDI